MSAGCGIDEDRVLTEQETYDLYSEQYNFMINNIEKYGDDIFEVLSKEVLDNKDIGKLLMLSRGLNDYVDFARGLPEAIDDNTKEIKAGVDKLYIYTNVVNDSLRTKYNDMSSLQSKTVEKDIIKLRKLTKYLDETERKSNLKKIRQEIVDINNIIK